MSIANRKGENKLMGSMAWKYKNPYSTQMKLRLDTGERKPTKEFYTLP